MVSEWGLCLRPGQVAVVNPQLAALPEPRLFSGVILTGSHSMVTDHEAWSEQTARWIPAVMEASIPLLGICYGHQVIGYALGVLRWFAGIRGGDLAGPPR